MNFLGHFVIATRFLTPVEPASAYVIGTALPDLLPLAAERVRLRPTQLVAQPPRTEFDAAMSAGVRVHLATDAAFHKSQAFATVQAEVGVMLSKAAFEGIRVRRFFVSHVLTELTLDAALLRADPSVADQFYETFAGADFDEVTHWAEATTGRPLPRLSAVLKRFSRAEYLRQYQSDTGVASSLSQVCRRARQDTFEGENFTRLIEVVRATADRLPEHLSALLSEPARCMLGPKQEEAST